MGEKNFSDLRRKSFTNKTQPLANGSCEELCLLLRQYPNQQKCIEHGGRRKGELLANISVLCYNENSTIYNTKNFTKRG